MSHPLQDIYDRIPAVNCAGHCGRDRTQTCCGPIACTEVEAQLLDQYDGIRSDWQPFSDGVVMMAIHNKDGQIATCPHLGLGGQCTAYEARPEICRIWGAIEALPCPWGCKPERLLNRKEARRIHLEIRRRTELL